MVAAGKHLEKDRFKMDGTVQRFSCDQIDTYFWADIGNNVLFQSVGRMEIARVS